MDIEQEWLGLKACLTEEQEHDGRRCFYAGILLVLSELVQGNDLEIDRNTTLIRKVLKKGG